MMSTPPDENLADDDLDITAKLPILSSADIVDASLGVDDATGEYRTQLDATDALSVEAGGHSDLTDELVSVRDRIVSLEAALADAEIRLTQLHARHDSLQSQHADLLIHSEAVSRGRDRLAEESRLSLASRQQLQDQLAQQWQHGEALQAELLTAQQKFAEQHASAAALARSMAQALLEKDDLQRSLAAGEQRIAALESRFSDTSAQLASAIANAESLVQSVEAHQQEISERTRQAAELQRDLALASERIEHLVSQVETENSHWRAAEQDRERLCQTLATERETLENARRELSERQGEIGSLQDALNRVVIENDQLGEQLAERSASLNARQEVIASQERELLVRAEAQAALMQREATLLDGVTLLHEQLEQLQSQLQQARQELAAKDLEQGASARQVEALQVELHQHVEAMQAIRRDIHQVAVQTRKDEGGTLLRTLTREDAEGVVHLLNKSSMSIGRGHECDIRLRSSSVSRYHAVLRLSHDAVIFEDMHSTNGCFVNGRRIKRQLLKDGDRLKVGEVPLRFSIRTKQD